MQSTECFHIYRVKRFSVAALIAKDTFYKHTLGPILEGCVCPSKTDREPDME